jgi:hypothetical protein
MIGVGVVTKTRLLGYRTPNFRLFLFLFSIVSYALLSSLFLKHEFYDRNVYVEAISNPIFILNGLAGEGGISFLLREPIWNFGILYLHHGAGLSIDLIFHCISMICIYSYARIIIRRVNIGSVLLLFVPIFIDLIFSQLRMALAVSFFFLFLDRSNRWLLIGFLIASLIHTVVAIVFFSIIITRIGKTYVESGQLNNRRFELICIAAGMIFSLMLGPLRYWLLSGIGDRRYEYDLSASGIMYASFWIQLLLFIFFIKKNNNKNIESCGLSLFYLTLYVALTFWGVFGARFLVIGLPFFIVTIMNFERPVRTIICCLYIIYMTLLWFMWWS